MRRKWGYEENDEEEEAERSREEEQQEGEEDGVRAAPPGVLRAGAAGKTAKDSRIQ